MATIQIQDDIKYFVTKYANLAHYLDNCLINRSFHNDLTFEYLRQSFLNAMTDVRYKDCQALIQNLQNKIRNCSKWQDAWFELSQSPIQAKIDCLEFSVGNNKIYRFDAEFDTLPLTVVFCPNDPNEIHIFHVIVPYLTSIDKSLTRFHQFYQHRDLFSVLYSYDAYYTGNNFQTLCFRDKPDLKFQTAVFFGVRDKSIITCPYTNDAIKLLVKKC